MNEKKNKVLLDQDRLWSSHFWQTRAVVIDAATKSSCLKVDLDALYEYVDKQGVNFGLLTQNVKAGKKLAEALRIHIDIAVEIVTAAIQKKPIDELYKKWSVNAADVAAVYAKYNRRIKYKKMNKMMQAHLETTLAEAVAIISGNCTDSYEKGEAALDHVYMMSSYIMSKFMYKYNV
jgi:hypothetical protein